jgi:UDP:flavonoid glycosyltransferase YjiC (YdhE family)
MARVLIAWELGGDYGHLSRLLPVALELRRRGHEPVFAVRDLGGAEAILGAHGMRWLQAPLWIGQVTNLPPAISYPELLMRFGFLSSRALTGICRAWRNLVALVAPDLVLFDHAPTGLLATRGLGLPRVNIGTGFAIPPNARPIPPYRWWQRENMTRVEDSERHVWQTANEVLFALDAPPLPHLADLASCDATLMCTFPELDHFPERAPCEYAGPIFSLGQGVATDWPKAGHRRVFAYLKAGYRDLERVLEALARSGASVLAHVPGASRQTLNRHGTSTMHFSERPVDMQAASAECDLAICHAGAGTTAAMLLAGKPLLLLPMQMEQTMTSKRLEALGAAVVLPPESAAQTARFLKRALTDPSLDERARSFASSHAGYDQTATVRRAADRCEALLAEAD